MPQTTDIEVLVYLNDANGNDVGEKLYVAGEMSDDAAPNRYAAVSFSVSVNSGDCLFGQVVLPDDTTQPAQAQATQTIVNLINTGLNSVDWNTDFAQMLSLYDVATPVSHVGSIIRIPWTNETYGEETPVNTVPSVS